MDHTLQPPVQSIPACYPAAYPQIHTQLPAAPKASTPSHQPPTSTPSTREASSKFSTTDAVRQVLKGLATFTEILYFAGKTVSIYTIKLGALIFGGIKGLLRYAHENDGLNNRTVKPVQLPTSLSQAGQNQAEPKPGLPPPAWQRQIVPEQADSQAPDAIASRQMPLEEYVRVDASEALNSLPDTIKTLGSVSGIICAFLTPYLLLGPLGLIINIPWILGVEPFALCEALSKKPEPMLTLPVTFQDNPTSRQPEPDQKLQHSKSATTDSTAARYHLTENSQHTMSQTASLNSQHLQMPRITNTMAQQHPFQDSHILATTSIIPPQCPRNPSPHFQQITQHPQQTLTGPQPVINNQPTQPTQPTPVCSDLLWYNMTSDLPQLVPYATLP